MQMARSRAQPIKWEYFWRLANQESVILPSLERKLRKNALRLNQSAISNFALYVISICNRMRPSRIKDKFSRVFSKFSQNCPSRVATRAICENFENTSENLSLILRGLNAITCL